MKVIEKSADGETSMRDGSGTVSAACCQEGGGAELVSTGRVGTQGRQEGAGKEDFSLSR